MKRQALSGRAIVVVCIAASTLAAPAILQRAQDHLTARWIDAALARTFPRSTHGGVRLDAGESRIVVEDLTLPAPGLTITLGRLVLPYRHGTISDIVAPAWAQDNTVSARQHPHRDPARAPS